MKTLDQLNSDDCTIIWNAFESGQVPSGNYLPAVYFDRLNILGTIQKDMKKICDKKSIQETHFIIGERGMGKTTVLKTVYEYAKEEGVVPIYLDLSNSASSLEFLRRIFYGLAGGIFQKGNIDENERSQLEDILETFAVELNFFKVRPKEGFAPTNKLNKLLELFANCDIPVAFLIDELDVLSIIEGNFVLEQVFEIFKNIYDISRLRKIWIFGATKSSYGLFLQAKDQGNAFASRIFQAHGRTITHTLTGYSLYERDLMANKLLKVFSKYKNDLYSLFSDYHSFILHTSENDTIPRNLIGNFISKIAHFIVIESEIRHQATNFNQKLNPIKYGGLFDSVFKKKIFKMLGKSLTGVEFSNNPSSHRSMFDADKNRQIDGQLSFQDGFKIGLELKFSDKNAKIDQHGLDQVLSYLHHNPNSEAIYLLIGSFDNKNPFSREHEQILINQNALERIKWKSVPTFLIKSFFALLKLAEINPDENHLNSIMNICLLYFDLSSEINKYYVEHIGEIPPTPSPKSPPQTTKKDINLVPKIIQGLASGFISKLNEKNILTVNDLVNTNPTVISDIKGISINKARIWIHAGEELLAKEKTKA